MATSLQILTRKGSYSIPAATRVRIDPELQDEGGNRIHPHHVDVSKGFVVAIDSNPASPSYGTFDVQNILESEETVEWEATYNHSDQYNAAQTLQTGLGTRGVDPSPVAYIPIAPPGASGVVRLVKSGVTTYYSTIADAIASVNPSGTIGQVYELLFPFTIPDSVPGDTIAFSIYRRGTTDANNDAQGLLAFDILGYKWK